MKSPHEGIYATVDCGSGRPWRRRQVRQGHRSRHLLPDAVRRAGSGRPDLRRRWPYRGLRRRRPAHLRSVPEQRPHDPRLRIWRHRPVRTLQQATISAARPISMRRRKLSSRCRSFRKALVCAARCLPMPQRSTAARSTSPGSLIACDRHGMARLGRRRPDLGIAFRSDRASTMRCRSRRKRPTTCRNSTSACRPASDRADDDASGPFRPGRD